MIGKMGGNVAFQQQLQTQKTKLKATPTPPVSKSSSTAPTHKAPKPPIKAPTHKAPKPPSVSKGSTIKKVLKGLLVAISLPILPLSIPLLLGSETYKGAVSETGDSIAKGMKKIAKSDAFKMTKKAMGFGGKALMGLVGATMEGIMQTDWQQLFAMMNTVPDSAGMAARNGDKSYFESAAYGGMTSSSTEGTLRNAF